MTVIPHFQPMTRTIGLFLYEDFQLLDASGPVTAFEIAGRMASDAYRLATLSIGGGPVRSSSGIAIDTAAVANADAIDTLLVVGGEGSRKAMTCIASIAWLQARADDTRRMCSVCSGAFVLAAAGLLDNRRATTHWRRADQLQRLFPAVRVEPDRIHVCDGAVWTSAGITAGIDLALALVADDLGEALARRVAQEMVVYYRRPGGQSQFSVLAELGGDTTVFSPLFEWMRANLSRRLTVEDLAAHMAMSRATFPAPLQGKLASVPPGPSSGCGWKRPASGSRTRATRSKGFLQQPAFAIPSGCGVPLSAHSDSHRRP